MSVDGVCAPTACNRRQPACNAYNGSARDTHQQRILACTASAGRAKSTFHRTRTRWQTSLAWLTLCVARCMPCRPYACCRIGGILLVAFYNSWQSNPPTRSADVEAHRSNLDAAALPTCAADRRRVADNTRHTTCGMHHACGMQHACGMHHGAQQPAACAQALSSTPRGRLETTTPMAERASLERAEPVSLAPFARPEYSEYPHVSTQSSQIRAPNSNGSNFSARVRRHPA